MYSRTVKTIRNFKTKKSVMLCVYGYDENDEIFVLYIQTVIVARLLVFTVNN